MKTSENLDKLAPAFAKAQSEMGGAVKDSNNPFFKSKYADLTSVWKSCKEALHNNGFSVIQSPISVDGRIGVSTMLLHSSGQFISDEYTLSVKKQNDPQADGSSITYARRYALASFVGACPVDDDAEFAMDRNAPEPKQPDMTKRFLKKMAELKKAYPEAYQSVMDEWDDMDPERITNQDSRVNIINEITSKIGKAA